VVFVPATAAEAMIQKTVTSFRRVLRLAARFSFELLTSPF